VDGHIGGHDPVGEGHRPGNRGWFAIGAITGEQATEAANAVGDGEWDGGGAGDDAEREPVAADDDESGCDAADESSVPGEAHPAQVVHRQSW